MEICPTCKQPIRHPRSIAISNRFHGHVTWLARATGMSRKEVYIRSLILACEIEADGGSEYPHSIIDDVLYPHSTTTATNKEMITACEGVAMLAAEAGYRLPEGKNDV